MKNVFSNFFELHVNLCMHTYDLEDYLKTIGTKIENDDFFIVTEDGNCWIIDPSTFDGSLDEKKYSADGKIKELPNIDYHGLTKINIPTGVTSIRQYTFFGYNGLMSVTIGNGVTSIGNYAFSGCSDLASVTIPNSVTSIGYEAFFNCSSLINVTISNNVTSIGDYAFYGCRSLTSVTIPNNVTSIGDWAFWNCTNLKDIIFKGKTMAQVEAMKDYPWGIVDRGIVDTSIIKVA